MKAKTFITLDTESTGLGRRALAFDVGYTIATRKDLILSRQFLIREILTDPRVMLGAMNNGDWRDMMGAKLFNAYIPALDASEFRLASWQEFTRTLRDDMATHSVDVFAAYNLPFDMRALAQTQAHILGAGKVLDYRPDLLCLWNFSASTVCQRPTYHKAAQQFGWISDAGNVRTNAEKVYAYLTGNFDFIEKHTALDDALIETEILQRLLAAKKPIPYNELDHGAWRKAQQIS